MLRSPELAVFQSLWAMEDLPSTRAPWTLRQQLDRITAAGFAGIAVDLGATHKPAAPALAPLLEETGLQVVIFAFVADDAGLRAAITYAHAVGAQRMVVCAQIYGLDPAPLAKTLIDWYHHAANEGITIEFETHRNTVANDLRFTVALLDYLPEQIRLAGDLSHFVCANEIPDEPSEEHEALFTAVLSRCGSLQGRIATRAQVQIPLGTAAGARWEQHFRRWWQQGFASILSRTADNAPVMFCCELGTRPYAITDRDGNELSDRWLEALILKDWAAEAYAQASATHHLIHSDQE